MWENSEIFITWTLVNLKRILNSYRKVFETSSLGFSLIDKITGDFLSVNSRFLNITAFSKEDIKGKNIVSVFTSMNSQNKRYSLEAISQLTDFFIFNRDYEKIIVRVEKDEAGVDSNCLLISLDKPVAEYRRLRKKSSVTKELFLVARIAEEINSSLELDVILDNTLDRIISATKSDAALVMFMDENNNLNPIASRGMSKEFIEDLKERTIRADIGTRSKAILLGKTIEANSSSKESESFLTGALINTEKLETMVTSPLKSRDEVIGIMSLGRRKKFKYSGKDLELVDAIGNHVVIAVKNARLYEQVKTRYLTLVSQLPDMVMVHKEERIIYVNPAVQDILGYSSEELTDTSILDYVTHKDREIFAENIKNIFHGEGSRDYEIEMTEKSGKLRTVIIRTSSITHENEAAFLSILIDITEIKKVESKLRKQAVELDKKIKELTFLYSVAQIVARDDFPIKKILKKMIKLFSRSCHYADFIPVKLIIDNKVYCTKDFPKKKGFKAANILVDNVKRGTVRFIIDRLSVSDKVFLEENRNLINSLVREVCQLIQRREAEEAREKLQEQLRHADRLATIGKLSAGIAHELNEPLGNILGFAQLTQKNSGLPEQAKKDVAKIEASSLYAREVVRKLMHFSRQMPQKKKNININQVVNDALYLFEARCERNRIELLRILSENLPEIHADPSQLTQVLVNLVVNSVQAMDKGGTLHIKTFCEDNKVILIVEDTGSGMTEDIIGQIFNPFFTTKDIGQGTGLGLSVVHGIVTSHKGTISVESEVNKGSRFKISLPVANG